MPEAADERAMAGYRVGLVGITPAVTRDHPMRLRRTAIALAVLLLVALGISAVDANGTVYRLAGGIRQA